jgi:hypothetical protein
MIVLLRNGKLGWGCDKGKSGNDQMFANRVK